jgi:hypothetical protein
LAIDCIRAARPRQIGIRAGLIVENADPEGFGGERGRGGQRQEEKEDENSPEHLTIP